MEHTAISRPGTTDGGEIVNETVPDWWIHAREFPHWYVWRGVTGHYYARVPGFSPQRVVRAPSPSGLRDEIALAELARRSIRFSSHIRTNCA